MPGRDEQNVKSPANGKNCAGKGKSAKVKTQGNYGYGTQGYGDKDGIEDVKTIFLVLPFIKSSKIEN